MTTRPFSSGGSGGRRGFGRTRFDSLDDTFPYAGKADLFVVVNHGETGLTAIALPPIAITDVFVVDSEEEMLGLTAEVGDVAIRTDIDESFILQVADPSILSHWVQLLVTPVHALGSAQHSADTIANIQTKVSDGFFITSAAAEITGLDAKASPVPGDAVMIEDSEDSDKKKKVALSGILALGSLYWQNPIISIFDNTGGLP